MKINRRVLFILFLLLLFCFEAIYFFMQIKKRHSPVAAIELRKEIAFTREAPKEELAIMGNYAAMLPERYASETSLKPKPGRIEFIHSAEDVTGAGNVRVIAARAGVKLNVTDRSSIGVEAGRKIHDSQDAEAWDQSVKDGNEAHAKLKISF